MRPLSTVVALLLVTLLVGCGSAPTSDSAEPQAEAPATAETKGPEFLERPFTAEQIQSEFQVGLTIRLRRSNPEGTRLERWTVVRSDEEGTDIEHAVVDENDTPAFPPEIVRSSWTQLRDHANFPAANARREEVTRDTELGTLDGWLYTVEDPAQGTVQEFFFATSLPGAPVEMRALQGGEVVYELVQIGRTR